MKKTVILGFVAICSFLVWYLFIRTYDLKVSFKLNTTPGTINQVVKSWSNGNKNLELTEQKSINSYKQIMSLKESCYLFNWEVQLLNDSTSQVNVYVSEPANGIVNRLAIPFVETTLEKNAGDALTSLYRKTNEHLRNFKVRVLGVASFDSTYCVYIPLKTSQQGKAFGMMGNYSLLSSFIVENNVETNGVPFVEVTEWDWREDEIKYNFCYPIKKPKDLPQTPDLLKYKWLAGKKAVSAIYNGNYITSDRAWYALEQYAEKNNLEIIGKPIEFFYNNPNFGGKALEWKAEIYLPIK